MITDETTKSYAKVGEELERLTLQGWMLVIETEPRSHEITVLAGHLTKGTKRGKGGSLEQCLANLKDVETKTGFKNPKEV